MEENKKKILLVDDDEGFAFIVQKSFEKTEFEMIAARNGEEGVEKALEEKPDLILLDVMMPGMDGMQVTEKLKEYGCSIPIIYLSNVADPRKISESIVASGGEADYIVKTDIHVEEIIDRIRKRLA